MKTDIVIPVFNEHQSLALLIEEIETACDNRAIDTRLIFIDDGSIDDSWCTIRELASENPRVCGVRFDKNYGKSAALQAGFDQCRGDLVITMDADLQDDPAEIPRLLEEIEELELDLVCGWKKIRYDGALRQFLSSGFNWLVNCFTGMKLHDHNCGYKVMRRECLACLRMDRGMHRFLTVMAAASGKQVGEMVVHHRPRQFGKSKYGIARIFRGIRDLLKVSWATRFGKKPIAGNLIKPRPVRIIEKIGNISTN